MILRHEDHNIVDYLYGVEAETLLSAATRGCYPVGKSMSKRGYWDYGVPYSRDVITVGNMRMSLALTNQMINGDWCITLNTAFPRIVYYCASVQRDSSNEHIPQSSDSDPIEYIASELIKSYLDLKSQKKAYSIEVWSRGLIVGGLFGLLTGDLLTIESMFSIERGAARAAMLALEEWCLQAGVTHIDCHMSSVIMETMGATPYSIVAFDVLKSEIPTLKDLSGQKFGALLSTELVALKDARVV